MSNDTILPFDFPAVGRKKLTAAFDGGRITFDGGVCCLVPWSGPWGSQRS
jgi:hypothetical protein